MAREPDAPSPAQEQAFAELRDRYPERAGAALARERDPVRALRALEEEDGAAARQVAAAHRPIWVRGFWWLVFLICSPVVVILSVTGNSSGDNDNSLGSLNNLRKRPPSTRTTLKVLLGLAVVAGLVVLAIAIYRM